MSTIENMINTVNLWARLYKPSTHSTTTEQMKITRY